MKCQPDLLFLSVGSFTTGRASPGALAQCRPGVSHYRPTEPSSQTFEATSRANPWGSEDTSLTRTPDPKSTPYLPVPPPGQEAPGVCLDGDGCHTNQLVQVTDQVASAMLLEDDGCPGLLQSSGSDGLPWVKRWQCEWVARASAFTMNQRVGGTFQ